MRLVTALLVKDEADKYLRRVLDNALSFSDRVLLLNDNSHDATPKIAKEMGCQVRGRSVLKESAWGKEAPARAELFQWASHEAGDGWILIQDADQVLHGDPRPLMETWEANAWAWPLYDCWDSETQYRADGYWQGYKQARVWMVRPSMVPPDWKPVWGDRGLHCGHIPPNFPMAALIAPDSLYWLHLGWMREDHRVAKYARYKAEASQLSPQEFAHVESIMDG